MNDEDRKKLARLLELMEGLTLEHKGIRRHISSAADISESVLNEAKRVLLEIRNEDRKRGHTWPGDSK